jgi:hypothetical protein
MKTTGDYVLTPQGRVHKSRIHQVGPDGEAGPPGPAPAPAPFPPSTSVVRAVSPNGWKASATFAASVPLGKMSVKFKVPEPPGLDGAIIYLFAGAENAQMKMILQPVLQWGNNGLPRLPNSDCSDGDCWTIACWYVSPDGQWYVSDPKRVNPGDTVTGTVEAVWCGAVRDASGGSVEACEWKIEASTSKVATALKNGDILENGDKVPLMLPWLMLFLVGAALEAYPQDPCCAGIVPEQYPASGATTFDHIELTDLAGNRFVADWNARCALDDSGCDCTNTVQISRDMSTVTLNY